MSLSKHLKGVDVGARFVLSYSTGLFKVAEVAHAYNA